MCMLSTPLCLISCYRLSHQLKSMTAWNTLCAQFPSVLCTCALFACSQPILPFCLSMTSQLKPQNCLTCSYPSSLLDRLGHSACQNAHFIMQTHAYTCSAAKPTISIPCCKQSLSPFLQMRFCLFASWQDKSRAPFPVFPTILWFLLCNDLRHLFDVIWPRIHCNAQNLNGACSMHPVPWCLYCCMHTGFSAKNSEHTLLNYVVLERRGQSWVLLSLRLSPGKV